jgi:putative ABC transport system permease protein
MAGLSVYADTLRMAARALRSRVLRSALTVSGVVIGITAVVGMSAVIRGVDAAVLGDIGAMNPNVIFLDRTGIVFSREQWEKARRRPHITHEDLRAVEEGCRRTVAHADPLAQTSAALEAGRARTRDMSLLGVGASYLEVQAMAVRTGRFFAPGEVERGARVILLGAAPADALFGPVDPVGKSVRLEGQEYLVIGTLASQAEVGGFRVGDDNQAAVPFEAYRRDILAGTRRSISVGILPRAGVSIERVIDDVTEVMRARHRLRASDENDFELLTQESVLALWRKVSRTIFLGLVGISSVALLVSGIGVLAVMTVAVTERTREVGVRRAVGARRSHILLQFLLEAAMLTAAGGALGSALGAAAAYGIGRAIELPVSTPPLTFALALGVSTLVGLVFGVVPAWRAARLDPVEALRYE